MAQTDLHIHSSLTAGGELSPRALAERCCEARLTLAALTDRRAVSGVPECIWRGAQLGVRIVPGVELDCRWREPGFSRARLLSRHHPSGAARDGTECPGKSGAAPVYGPSRHSA